MSPKENLRQFSKIWKDKMGFTLLYFAPLTHQCIAIRYKEFQQGKNSVALI